ncbi:MAG: 5-deoxy-glucuronate isomerase [Armatimonadota bacterium]
MNLLVSNALQDGCNAIRIGDFTAGDEIGFCIARMQAGETHLTRLSKAETAIVLLAGTCTVKCGDATYEHVGERENVFAGRATAVYAPPGVPVEVLAETNAEIAVAATPATMEGEPQLVTPENVYARSVGQWNWRREVHDVIGENVPAEKLLVGETYNPPGNWSSYPPHKHDEDNLPAEVKMEEVYHFRINPPSGFGVQRIYTAKHTTDGELDETYTVRDGDTVAIPRGYHPVGAAPGYQLYYLWILAGANRIMRPSDDPEHAWVKATEAVAAEMAR